MREIMSCQWFYDSDNKDVTKNRDIGFKNCSKFCDVIYERPLVKEPKWQTPNKDVKRK